MTGAHGKNLKMLSERLNFGNSDGVQHPHSTEEGGVHGEQGPRTSESELAGDVLESAPESPSPGTGLRAPQPYPSTQLISCPCKRVVNLSRRASLAVLVSSHAAAYLMLYFRQDFHQLVQRLVMGPQLHGTDGKGWCETAAGGRASPPHAPRTVVHPPCRESRARARLPLKTRLSRPRRSPP